MNEQEMQRSGAMSVYFRGICHDSVFHAAGSIWSKCGGDMIDMCQMCSEERRDVWNSQEGSNQTKPILS